MIGSFDHPEILPRVVYVNAQLSKITIECNPYSSGQELRATMFKTLFSHEGSGMPLDHPLSFSLTFLI